MAKGDVYRSESGLEVKLSGDSLREGMVTKLNGVYEIGHWSSDWSIRTGSKHWTLVPSINMEDIYKL